MQPTANPDLGGRGKVEGRALKAVSVQLKTRLATSRDAGVLAAGIGALVDADTFDGDASNARIIAEVRRLHTRLDKILTAAPISARKEKPVSEEYCTVDELARRWACSRTSVNRIIAAAGITRTLLGEGTKGIVRIPREEVLAYEKSRRTRLGNPPRAGA
jgi:hypothetical protein